MLYISQTKTPPMIVNNTKPQKNSRARRRAATSHAPKSETVSGDAINKLICDHGFGSARAQLRQAMKVAEGTSDAARP